MFDELLPYYSSELEYLRNMGAEFAAMHPEIAKELRIGGRAAYADPHVERLIEAVAFLTARVRQKLDDDFPEISASLLEILYPHHLSPSPSKAIVQFSLQPGQEGLTAGAHIPRESPVSASAPNGDPCNFRTCYPVALFPIHVSGVSFLRRSFAAPQRPEFPRPVGTLAIELTCDSPDLTFAQIECPSLRFMLHGHAPHVYQLYELLFRNTTDVAILTGTGNPPRLLELSALRAVGFGLDEGMVPYNARALLGYRIVHEYFSFPQKFHFFDVALGDEVRKNLPRNIQLAFNINRVVPELESALTRDSFRLGCTPVVNLYTQRVEPIAESALQSEYRLVPDARRPRSTEIYSVDKVQASAPGEPAVEYVPFFSFHHGDEAAQRRQFWHVSRRPAVPTAEFYDRGTETFLSIVDLESRPLETGRWTIHADVTCLNRDLPETLPFGGGEPRMVLETGGPVSVECLTSPTRTHRPAAGSANLWKLISHLSLNHLSIAGGADGAAALREILALYDPDLQHQARISAILSVASSSAVARVNGAFGRGKRISIDFDPEAFPNNDLFFFTAILDRFLGLFCTLNSFTQLAGTIRQAEFVQWPPRAGEKPLV